jgi:hypothetical protein
MTTNYLKLAVMAIIAGVMVTACGSTRGIKQDKEECQQLAIQKSESWRASGNGVSSEESVAYGIADINARMQLARQLEEQINSLRRLFNKQRKAGGTLELDGAYTDLAEGYTDKLLTNVKTICTNTYVKKDGNYNVYVCVEMGKENLSRIHKKLSDDKKLSIDVSESQFIKEMEKAKEEYRSRGE